MFAPVLSGGSVAEPGWEGCTSEPFLFLASSHFGEEVLLLMLPVPIAAPMKRPIMRLARDGRSPAASSAQLTVISWQAPNHAIL